MRTMGIKLGGSVLLVARDTEPHPALVMAMSMDPEQAGALGEMSIDAVCVNVNLVKRGGTDPRCWERGLLYFPDVVHLSHRDWIEGRAAMAYREIAGDGLNITEGPR